MSDISQMKVSIEVEGIDKLVDLLKKVHELAESISVNVRTNYVGDGSRLKPIRPISSVVDNNLKTIAVIDHVQEYYKKCSRCKSYIATSDKFCSYCGKPF